MAFLPSDGSAAAPPGGYNATGGATGEGAMSDKMSQKPDGVSHASWRDPANYKSLLNLDRAGWAWEWLRRNPDYIALTTQLPMGVRRLAWPGTGLKIIAASDADAAAGWGLQFRRGAKPPRRRCQHILARRLGRISVGHQGFTDAIQRCRRFRHPAFSSSGDCTVLS